MTQPGPAQMDLIRRYARTLRELHADAMRASPMRPAARRARSADFAHGTRSGPKDVMDPRTGTLSSS